MQIYVTHASSFDFQNEIYKPLRQSSLNDKHQIVLPHEDSDKQFDSKTLLRDCDLVLAEVSYPSTGQGIELGWADMYGVPILYFYRKGAKLSGSLKAISSTFIEYENQSDMISKLTEQIEKKVLTSSTNRNYFRKITTSG